MSYKLMALMDRSSAMILIGSSRNDFRAGRRITVASELMSRDVRRIATPPRDLMTSVRYEG